MDEMISALVNVLQEQKVPYVVIGGIAASILGRPRMTMDSDIVIILNDALIAGFIKKMKKKGFSVSTGSESKIVSRLQRKLPVKLRYKKHYSVDIRIASYSLDAQAINRAKKISLFSVKLPIVTPEDLIVYKVARFELIDQMDIQAILVKHASTLDIKYLKAAAQSLSVETGNEDIKTHLETVLKWLGK